MFYHVIDKKNNNNKTKVISRLFIQKSKRNRKYNKMKKKEFNVMTKTKINTFWLSPRGF